MKFSFQSKHWYWAVAVTLALGYVLGGIFPVALLFYGSFATTIPDAFRPVLLYFLVGVLGSNVQLSIYFSRDVNSVISGKNKVLPSCFEFFGYALKQLWGGIAAVFFVLAVKLGFITSVAGTEGDLRLPAAVFISFCAGLRGFKILEHLAGLAKVGNK